MQFSYPNLQDTQVLVLVFICSPYEHYVHLLTRSVHLGHDARHSRHVKVEDDQYSPNLQVPICWPTAVTIKHEYSISNTGNLLWFTGISFIILLLACYYYYHAHVLFISYLSNCGFSVMFLLKQSLSDSQCLDMIEEKMIIKLGLKIHFISWP